MKIIRNRAVEKQFEDICAGEVFITRDDGHLYMKTVEAYEYPNNRDCYLNAICLEDGSWVKINDWEKIFIPKNVTLTVDE